MSSQDYGHTHQGTIKPGQGGARAPSQIAVIYDGTIDLYEAPANRDAFAAWAEWAWADHSRCEMTSEWSGDTLTIESVS